MLIWHCIVGLGSRLLHVLGFCFLGFDLVMDQSHLCISICDGEYDSRKLVNGNVPAFG